MFSKSLEHGDIMSVLLFFFITRFISAFCASISCTNYESSASSPIGGPNWVDVSCASTDEVLVSCGWRSIDTTVVVNKRGSRQQLGFCRSAADEDSDSPGAVVTTARCCTFPGEDARCVGNATTNGDVVDNAYNTDSLTCTDIAGLRGFSDSYNMMLGCQGWANGGTLDGMWPGSMRPDNSTISYDTDYPFDPISDTCTVMNGGTYLYGSRVNANCCKSPSKTLDCVVRYGAPSLTDSNVSCGAGYTMTGCSMWQNATSNHEGSLKFGKTLCFRMQVF